MTDSIAGETAIITGASRGLGLEIARELGRRKARLVICARDGAALNRAADDLRADGAEVTAVTCDITEEAAPQLLIDAATSAYGHVDILFNNAGVISVTPLWNATPSDFETAMSTMALAPARLTLAVLPLMRSQGHGRIVNVTSLGGKVSVPHLLPYAMAKFAAVAFSEGLRAELGASPITVTTAVPGLMRTGSHLQALFRGQREKEFTWFSLGAALPVVSMDASRAARRIVSAMCARKPEVILTPIAQVVARGAGVFPGVTVRALHVIGALLPQPADQPNEVRAGGELRPALPPNLFDRLTTLARDAARRLNERSASGTATGGTR
jgi:short-subunit dehydrogenase